MKYDVQILVGDEWRWAGVEPTPTTQRAARHIKARIALDPYWREQIGATAFRVAPVPANDTEES